MNKENERVVNCDRFYRLRNLGAGVGSVERMVQWAEQFAESAKLEGEIMKNLVRPGYGI